MFLGKNWIVLDNLASTKNGESEQRLVDNLPRGSLLISNATKEKEKKFSELRPGKLGPDLFTKVFTHYIDLS